MKIQNSLLICCVLIFANTANAQNISFIKDVAPILKENCFACHGAKNPKGKLDMTKYEALRHGGTKDDPIVNGKPDESYFIDVLKATDKSRMPPKESGDGLSPEKIKVLEQWVAQGAKIDKEIDPKSDLLKELRLRWKAPSPAAKYSFPVAATAIAFSPDGKKIVVGGHHEITVWDIDGAKLEKRIHTRARRSMAFIFLPDGKLVVAGGRPGEEGDVRAYDISSAGKVVDGVAILDGVNDKKIMLKQLLDTDDEVLCLALSNDGKKLAAGGCDRLLHVWDISSGIENAKLEQSIENHADWVFSAGFSPDGKLLASSSRDKTAKVWNLASKESLATFPDHQNPVYGVYFKADGKNCYSAGDDKQLRLFGLEGDRAGKQVRVIGAHNGQILKVAGNEKANLIATGGADNSVKTWNAESGAAVKSFVGLSDQVLSLAFNKDGSLVAGGAWNGEVIIWKTSDATVVKKIAISPGLQTVSK
ncbi:MAG: c-type cytochrome domain-containing protein [Gemmataceae bacterium]|jgi:Planctomycete cytochrome C/WD domain, G-beta repeat/WD40-like Beta Propeller Repeat